MREHGFTLVELIVAIVIAGILAAVALPRWAGDTGFEARQFRDETVAALRLAQKSAIAARRMACANLSASQVGLTIAAAYTDTTCTGGTLTHPAGGAAVVTANGGATFAAGFPTTVVFDAAGRPTGGGATITVTGLAAMPITVNQETGYVQ